jgi:hypothetical protein
VGLRTGLRRVPVGVRRGPRPGLHPDRGGTRDSLGHPALRHQALLPPWAACTPPSTPCWPCIAKTEVTHEPAFDDGSDSAYTTRVTLTAPDGSTREQIVTHPRGGLDNPLSDDEIVAKYRMLTEHVVESGRRDAIQEAVLDLEISPQGPRQLMALLAAPVAAALA